MAMTTELKEFLESAQDWDKMKTDIPGIFIVKVPRKTQPARLMVEVNPISDTGWQMKRKGLYLSSLNNYLKFYELLSNTGKMNSIMRGIETVNPGSKLENVIEKTLNIEE
jgi:hypothetical protein